MKAIIVEDNPGAVNVLQSYLMEYPEDIEVSGVANSVEAAKKLIVETHPDIWLLDIRLRDKLVFHLIEQVDRSVVENAAIIFLTAYYEPEYIYEALKVSAIDFIVKPIDRDQLFKVLDKAIEQKSKTDLLARITKLENSIRQIDTRSALNRIPVHRANGEIDYVDKREIVYLHTDDDITRIILNDNQSIATAKPLKFYQDRIEGDSYMRISKQVILNLDYLRSFNPKDNQVVLTNGLTIQVSRRKSSQLMKQLSGE